MEVFKIVQNNSDKQGLKNENVMPSLRILRQAFRNSNNIKVLQCISWP